jgi:hypothetical protein
VYLAVGSRCLRLDAATGGTVREFELPAVDGQQPQWAFIGVYENLLLAGTGYGDYSQRLGYEYKTEKNRGVAWAPDHNGSLGLTVFDRHTGQTLWKVDAAASFLHNAIVAGGGRIYCLDRLPSRVEDHLRRRGQEPPAPRLLALDARHGQIIWQQTEKVFGTWLGYSQARDVLLEAGAAASDRSPDETGKGMATFRGADGTLLWEKPELAYVGPCILHNDVIITNTGSYKASQGAFRLLDGVPATIPHPLTEEPVAWNFARTYGCSTCVASEHLLTFRSGAAGFYDLASHSGTGNFGGFKSGCTSNLIVADGVLNAPEYTRTCTCAYQNQTSLALVHMPEAETWTWNSYTLEQNVESRIRRLGLNFGAPGDRRSEDGVLWLEHPPVGGSSPKVPVEVEGKLNWFRHHSSRISGAAPAWVAASGVEGVEKVIVWLVPREAPQRTSAVAKALENTAKELSRLVIEQEKAGEAPKPNPSEPALRSDSYTVRLHFVEPSAAVGPSQRVFGVVLQGRNVLARLDPVAEAGGPLRAIVKSFSKVPIADKLTIEFQPLSSQTPVLCGLELVAEQ